MSSERDFSRLSKEGKRIVPLGLTAQEARGWLLHEMIMPWTGKGLGAIAISLLLILPMLTSLSSELDSTLTLHMIAEHFLLIAAGFSFGYGLGFLFLAGSLLSPLIQTARAFLLRLNSAFNKQGVVAFVAAAILIGYWQIPRNFDAATLNESTHLGMHFTLVIAGALIYVGSISLARTIRQIVPVIAGKVMGLAGVFLLITQSHLYSIYPLSEQSETGLALVVAMLIIDFTIAPYWLYNYFHGNS